MNKNKVTTSQFLAGMFRRVAKDPVVEAMVREKMEEIANYGLSEEELAKQEEAPAEDASKAVETEGEEVPK